MSRNLRLPARRLASAVLLALAVAAAAVAAVATAAPPVPTMPQEGLVSAAEVEASIEAVEADQELDEENKGKTLERLRQALRSLERLQSSMATAELYAQAIEAAPAETEQLRKELEAPPVTEVTPGDLGVTDAMPLGELEQVLGKEQADLTALEAKLAEFEKQLQDQQKRPAEARQRLTAVKQNQEELSAALDTPPPAGEPAVRTDARRLALQLQRKAQNAEINLLDQELLSYNARLELLKARRDRTARSVQNVQRRVDLLQRLVNERRQAEAEQAREAAAEAEREAAGKHPAIRDLAQANADLTREIAQVTADLERLTTIYDQVERQAKQIAQGMQRAKQRVEIGGLSDVLGRMLLQEKRSLPSLAEYRRQVRARKARIADVGLAQVRLEEERRELADLDARLEESMATIRPQLGPGEDAAQIEQELRQLLKDRRALLEQAATAYGRYLRSMVDVDFAQRNLLATAQEYSDLLDEHLLWTPTSEPVSAKTAEDLVEAVSWALNPDHWFGTIHAFLQEAKDGLGATILAALLIGGLFWARRPLSARLHAIAGEVGKLSSDHIGLTFQALAIALVLALPWPLLLAGVGHLLKGAVDAPPFAQAVGGALFLTATLLYNFLAFRRFCGRDGPGPAHFHWSAEAVGTLRRAIDRLLVVLVPGVFVAALAGRSQISAYNDSLGRLAFMVIMAALALFAYRVFRPSRGVLAGYLRAHPESWLNRTRLLWYPLSFGAFLLFAALAAAGFYYTSAQLTRQIIDTLWLIVGIVVVHDLVIRWLALTRRKIAWQRALEKREAARAARVAEQQAAGEEVTEAETPPPPEPQEIDLDLVDTQTRKLLHVVLFFTAALGVLGIWADVLPALGALDAVSLWSHPVTVDGQEVIQAVTLGDLLLGLVVLAITVAAARNLPGVLEIAFLQRTALEPGSRYAVVTLTRYTIVTIGILVVLSEIGWDWSKIQWLVAALGVGLGFGLQEIVANFISGLIILFERPVRVGDTVTVGDLTGTVSRIRIRATTIIDWDRKEIVVPNKSFITERVINWTLSDPITRIVVPVGVAYGSDTEKAHRVMLETLRKMPLVLDEPAPNVYFVGFGESSLDFKLYVYSRQLSDRLPLTHEVHTAINRALVENGLEIPFPQRDLHLRSVDAGVMARARGEARPPEPGPGG